MSTIKTKNVLKFDKKFKTYLINNNISSMHTLCDDLNECIMFYAHSSKTLHKLCIDNKITALKSA